MLMTPVKIQITTDLFQKEINLDKFMARKPECVGTVAGIKFYEHPLYGDEVSLVAVSGDRCGYSHWYDVPCVEELAA